MKLVHNYNLSGINGHPSDQAINDFINNYTYVFPLIFEIPGGDIRLFIYGSNSTINVNYNESEDSFTITSDTTIYRLNLYDAVTEYEENTIKDISKLRVFTTEIGNPNTADVYCTFTRDIGDQLFQPEFGWKRYNGLFPQIKIIQGAVQEDNCLRIIGGQQGEYEFDFTGKSLRMLIMTAPSYNDSIRVRIDDSVDHHFSARTPSLMNYYLALDLQNLEEKRHHVNVKVAGNARSLNNDYRLEAIDIDSEGILIHPDE